MSDFKNWLGHPAFGLVLQITIFAAFFGGMQVKLAEVSAQLLEIKASIVKLEDKKENYAERFASLEARIRYIERENSL